MSHETWNRAAWAGGAAVLSILASAGTAQAQGGLRPLAAYEARVVDFAREGAKRRLRESPCRALLRQLHDAEGRPLEARLTAFGLEADEYLASVPFLDGTRRPLCGRGQSQLLTARGVPRIVVCPPFLQTVVRERETAEVYVIHELLHTLGLGENPPSSQQITQLVKRQCAP